MVLNLNLLFLDQIVVTFSSGTVKAKVSFDYNVEIGNICHFLNFYKISNYLASDIVHMVKGDDNGVVNCLEPHPNLPMMATSGRF